jgi:hypothetical protein
MASSQRASRCARVVAVVAAVLATDYETGLLENPEVLHHPEAGQARHLAGIGPASMSIAWQVNR